MTLLVVPGFPPNAQNGPQMLRRGSRGSGTAGFFGNVVSGYRMACGNVCVWVGARRIRRCRLGRDPETHSYIWLLSALTTDSTSLMTHAVLLATVAAHTTRTLVDSHTVRYGYRVLFTT